VKSGPDAAALDLDAAIDFIERMFPAQVAGWVSIGAFEPPRWKAFSRADVAGMRRWISELDGGRPTGIYLRTTTVSPGLATAARGGDDGTVEVVGLWSDLDYGTFGHKPSPDGRAPNPPNQAGAELIVATSGLPEPTIWVHSGGGLYAWWLFPTPLNVVDPGDRAAARRLSERVQRALEDGAKALGWHYGNVGDLARVLRLPGTVNRKAGGARPCRLIGARTSWGARRYTLAEFNEIVPQLPEPSPGPIPRTAHQHPLGGAGAAWVPSGTPCDDWELITPWSDILTPHGWAWSHRVGTTDYWIRPGKGPKEGHSATTGHDPVRDRMFVFSDAAGLPQSTPLSKPFVEAYYRHGGDMGALTRDLKGRGFGTPSDSPAANDVLFARYRRPEGVDCDDTANEVASTPLNLDVDFWGRRPILARIKEAADCRLISPDAVLGAALARVASRISPNVRVDTGIGRASLNFMAAMIGTSAAGKSSAEAAAEDLIGGGAALPLGSGEGIAEAYYGWVEEAAPEGSRAKPRKVHKKVRDNALFFADEGEALSKQMERSGATIGQALRTAWVGATIGQANASVETKRIVEKGTYSLGLIIGYQRTTVAPLLAEGSGGTPQRFVFMNAHPADLPQTQTPWPGAILNLEHALPRSDIIMPDEIKLEIWESRRADALDRERNDSDLNGHASLHLTKIAALLAILDWRARMTQEDWDLAHIIWDTSCAVRDDLIREIEARAAQEIRAREDRTVRAQVRGAMESRDAMEKAADATVARVACWVGTKVHAGVRRVGGREGLRNGLPRRDRALLAEALLEAQRLGYVVIGQDEDGLEPGASRPA
jgi:hypothetical protein